MKQKRNFTILLILLIQFSSIAQNDKRTDPLCYTGSFMKVVKRNDAELTIKHLDKDYVKVQLKEFLKNNEEQFLNELFSGQDINTNEYLAVDFLSINDITLIEIKPDDETSWIVYFQITTETNVIKSDLRLVLSKRFFRKRLGFVGSFG